MTDIVRIGHSICPHDPPSICVLDVELMTDDLYSLKLEPSSARTFRNTTLAETKTSRKCEIVPGDKIKSEVMAMLAIGDGARIRVADERGEIVLIAARLHGSQRGAVVVDGIHHNRAFATGEGITTLTRSHRAAPYGGSAFHDSHVRIKPV